MEWLGTYSTNDVQDIRYNNHRVREQCTTKQKTIYLLNCGHLIDAPPSHPDTALTTFHYMKKSLCDQGTNYANISVDIQLYIATPKLKWIEPWKCEKVIPHPGAMHILMSFMDCNGNFMKGLELDGLVGAALKELASIMSWKSWVMSMQTFCSITAELLKCYHQDMIPNHMMICPKD